LRKEFPIQIHWVAFPLHPETPQEGQTMEQLFAGRGFDVKAAMAKLAKVAEELDLPFAERTMTYNSRRAQELGKWAEEQGRGDEFHDLAFRAYFAHSRNLAEEDVLRDVARQAGLDPDGAWEVIQSGAKAKAVDTDWRYSRERGVTAVPSFLMNGNMMVGAQPYAKLASLVQGGSQILEPLV
jgi:predicted DsbA family dithiol-disulfide isomerase